MARVPGVWNASTSDTVSRASPTTGRHLRLPSRSPICYAPDGSGEEDAVATRLYDRVVTLADRLDVLDEAPGRSRAERAVYDAWAAAVKPRIKRMQRHAEWVADPRQWEFDDDRYPKHLQPSVWSRVVREYAGLYTELAGALGQHRHVRIVWTPRTQYGIQRGQSRRIPEGKSKDRAKMAQEAQEALDKARKAKVKDAKETLEDVLKRLATTRTLLEVLLDETRHLVAALQADEEARLAARVARMAEGSRKREQAEDLLVELAQGRLRAARHGAEQASGWGSLVRTAWLAPRAKLVRAIEGP